MEQSATDEDEYPVWSIAPGAEITTGVLAWERLGVGYRCETWLGWARSLWCPVTVKLARPHQRNHPRARQSLRREVDALQGNLHPVLPRLFTVGIDDEIPHIVTEFVDGEPLDVLAEQAPLDDRSAAMLAVQLLSALTALHRRCIAHLDVKPDNVIVSGGHPTLIDFGSARRVGSAQPAGLPVGTVGFAAPEMEACEPISAAMDVFGVGATLRRVRTAIRADRPEPDRADHRAPTELTAALDRLVDDMLSPRACDRPTVPAALDAFAGLFDADERPWPAWLSADRTYAAR